MKNFETAQKGILNYYEFRIFCNLVFNLLTIPKKEKVIMPKTVPK